MRKIFALILAVACSMTVLSGCGNNGGSNDSAGTVTIWCAEQDSGFVAQRLEQFKAANPDEEIDIRITPKGEPDVAGALAGDPTVSAELFYFPDDKLLELVNQELLYPLPNQYKTKVARDNSEGFVNAATVGNNIYAFPKSADNTFYLYYNKKYLPTGKTEFETLDEIFEKVTTGKFLRFDYTNSWYGSTLLFTAGGKIWLDEDNNLETDFDDEDVVAKALQLANKIITNKSKISTTAENSDLIDGFTADDTVAAFSGAWNYEALKAVLQDNLGMQALPGIKFSGETEVTPLRSFAGYKMLGINSTISNPAKMDLTLRFADFLSNEDGQRLMLTERSYAPCNKVVAASPEASEDPVVKVVSDQFKNSNIQRDAINNFWDGVKGVGVEIYNSNSVFSQGDFNTIIDTCVNLMRTKPI